MALWRKDQRHNGKKQRKEEFNAASFSKKLINYPPPPPISFQVNKTKFIIKLADFVHDRCSCCSVQHNQVQSATFDLTGPQKIDVVMRVNVKQAKSAFRALALDVQPVRPRWIIKQRDSFVLWTVSKLCIRSDAQLDHPMSSVNLCSRRQA